MRLPRWWPTWLLRCRRRRRGRGEVREVKPAGGNGHAAAAARATQERKLREAWRLWPEVRAARDGLDELARAAEQAMRRPR